MTRLHRYKTGFTAGEVSPNLLGRPDLRAFDNGAKKLSNVIVHPTGGLSRRAGLRFVDEVPAAGRLVAFEFNTEQTYLLAFGNYRLDIYKDDSLEFSLATPWGDSFLQQISWTQSADTLLVLHPNVEPRKIIRLGAANWTIQSWKYFQKKSRTFQPYHNFAPDIRLTYRGPSGTELDPRLIATQDIFTSNHLGVRILFRAEPADNSAPGPYHEFSVSQIIDAKTVKITPSTTLIDDNTQSGDWMEQAFSNARGWPLSAAFHQNRLVVGGSRDLPNHLWMSKTSDLFNFDLGDGKDDDAIHFQILSDQVNAIRAVIPGRNLQVMTSGAEWTVSGTPMTPSRVQVSRQTRVGSRVDRWIPPRDVEGASLFVSRDGRRLNEFIFTDLEQAYRTNDLTLMAEHLIDDIVDLDYDPAGRLLYVVDADGHLACLTQNRNEQVTAWTRLETNGQILSIAVVEDRIYVMVLRNGGCFIEKFDATLALDSAASGVRLENSIRWGGFEHLEGETITVLANDFREEEVLVEEGGVVTLSLPAITLVGGLAFRHVVEPLPPLIGLATGIDPGRKVRLVKAAFRFLTLGAMDVDSGAGVQAFRHVEPGNIALEIPPAFYSGDLTIGGLGWRQNGMDPLWTLSSRAPFPFSLLSVTTEIKVSS